jgi:hypothetical protein
MVEENKKIEEFPSNSQHQEEPQKESQKIVKQVATARRITKNKTFFNTVLAGTLKAVGSYVFFEVLIPAAKSTLSDMVNNATDMFLYGEPGVRRRNRDRERVTPRVSYTDYYGRDKDRGRDRDWHERERHDRLYGRFQFDTDDILIPSRDEAEDVIQGMLEIFDQYNAITVSDFMELVGLPDEYTDLNYGWTNLRDVHTKRVRDGYIIELPGPKPLSR